MPNKEKIICPNCGEPCYFNIDEWGYTPIHLHCKRDKINIGATSFKKCIELLSSYHEPETYLEFFNNEIQWMYIGKKEVINNLEKEENLGQKGD